MMETSDADMLKEMSRAISTSPSSSAELGILAEKLLILCDNLRLDDEDWLHDLTQHILTLDSASTFVSSDDKEKIQVRSAVEDALINLRRLVGEKQKAI